MKMYCFRVCMYGYGLDYRVESDRLDHAVRALYDLCLELGPRDEPLLVCSRYSTYRVFDGVKVNERYYNLKRELKGCVSIVSEASYNFYCCNVVSLSEFLDAVRAIDDEPETRPENIGMRNIWSY